MARPTKYEPEYTTKLIEYFRDAPVFEIETREVYNKKKGEVETIMVKTPARCPTFVRFSDIIGVNTDTLLEWSKDPEKPEFSAAYKKAKEYQEDWLQNSGGMGFFNCAMSIMSLKANHNWTDRVETVDKSITKKVFITQEEKKKAEEHIESVINGEHR